jgi:crossover junction endodeoxyribonuclease RuvC
MMPKACLQSQPAAYRTHARVRVDEIVIRQRAFEAATPRASGPGRAPRATRHMTRILGIDPGSVRTGIGIVDADATGRATHVFHAAVVLGEAPSFPLRLKRILDEIGALIERYAPDEVAIERVFIAKNADSALKLGQARGAAICAVVQRDLPVNEYSPMQIKQAVVGRGIAEKAQVQHMVGVLLGLRGAPIQADAADALAIAITHAHSRTLAAQVGVVSSALLRRRR